jgi:hypothetical protein
MIDLIRLGNPASSAQAATAPFPWPRFINELIYDFSRPLSPFPYAILLAKTDGGGAVSATRLRFCVWEGEAWDTALMQELRNARILVRDEPEAPDQRDLIVQRHEQNVAPTGSSPIPSHPVKSA